MAGVLQLLPQKQPALHRSLREPVQKRLLQPAASYIYLSSTAQSSQRSRTSARRATASSFESERPRTGQGNTESTSERLRHGYQEVESRFRRTAADVDTKYDLSGKAQQAATRVREQARAVDSKFGIQHKLRSLSDDFRRQLPQTTLGQIATTAFVVYLFASGLAFKLLNVLFILWWLLPIIALPLARKRNQQAQAQAQQQRQRQQTSMAEELLRRMQGGAFKGRPSQNREWQNSSSKGRDYSNMGDGGPVIDAEWTTVDEDK